MLCACAKSCDDGGVWKSVSYRSERAIKKEFVSHECVCQKHSTPTSVVCLFVCASYIVMVTLSIELSWRKSFYKYK